MENIIKKVAEKANISESQAQTAVDAVVSFLKDKMPGGMGAQVETFIKGGNDTLSGVGSNIKDKVGDIFGK